MQFGIGVNFGTRKVPEPPLSGDRLMTEDGMSIVTEDSIIIVTK